MLKSVYISHPDLKREFLADQPDYASTWVVAHIEARRLIQNFLLQEKSTVAGNTVLRASELWLRLFTLNYPQWKVVSDSFIFILIEDWFDQQNVDIEFKNIECFYNFFDQILPILSSENSVLFEEWLEGDPERAQRLTGWWTLAQKFWSLLSEKKWITRSWCPSILLQHQQLQYPSSERYIFDLGTDVKHLELELILKISEVLDVTVLIPKVDGQDEYQRLLSVYARIVEQSKSVENLSSSPKGSIKKTITSSSSVLGEVKMAVSQVRLWLDAGVLPQRIAIVSPNIEEYWNMIRPHLQIEGVAANKSYVARAVSLPEVQVWLSRIHLYEESFDQNDLESTLFNTVDPKFDEIDYSDFQKKFSRLYDGAKAKKILNIFPSQKKKNTFSIVEFLDQIYNLWLKKETSLIDRIADDMFTDADPEWQWTWRIWVKYLELVLSRIEVPLVPPNKEGIWINNLSPSDWEHLTHVIVLGCQQGALREQLKTPASAKDIFAIQRDLGFYLNQTESVKKEFDLSWLMKKQVDDLVLSRSETDAKGDPQMTSSFWLKESLSSGNQKGMSSTQTRWDELMRQPLRSILKELAVTEGQHTVFEQRLGREPEVSWMKNLQVPIRPSLSATSLTKLAQCSFKFYAEKVLKLSESQVYDLDMDPMYQGSLMHRVLELLLIHHPSLNVSQDEVSVIYDSALEQEPDDGEHREFWVLEKPRHLKIIMSFIEAEKEWRKQFPNTQPMALEQSIDGYMTIDEDSLKLSRSPSDSDSYMFRGKIDRVDEDQNGYLGLIDYKAAKNSSILSYKSWVKNDQFQLALYSMAIEQGLIEGWMDKKVGAAFYLFLKDQQRGLGFVVDYSANSFMKSKPISEDEKNNLWLEMSQKMATVLNQLKIGNFSPVPKDIKICENCSWRLLCRAPHL